MNISSNVSSIQSHTAYMNANANNVANINTDGFVPTDTTLNASEGGGVTASFSQASSNGSQASQTDLSKEMTDQVVIEKAVAANVTAIRTQDEMFGSLLDIKA